MVFVLVQRLRHDAKPSPEITIWEPFFSDVHLLSSRPADIEGFF